MAELHGLSMRITNYSIYKSRDDLPSTRMGCNWELIRNDSRTIGKIRDLPAPVRQSNPTYCQRALEGVNALNGVLLTVLDLIGEKDLPFPRDPITF